MGTEELNEPSRLLTVSDVAERLNISVRSVFAHIAEGDLPRVKFGHRTVRILESDVEAFVNGLRRAGQKGGW